MCRCKISIPSSTCATTTFGGSPPLDGRFTRRCVFRVAVVVFPPGPLDDAPPRLEAPPVATARAVVPNARANAFVPCYAPLKLKGDGVELKGVSQRS